MHPNGANLRRCAPFRTVGRGSGDENGVVNGLVVSTGLPRAMDVGGSDAARLGIPFQEPDDARKPFRNGDMCPWEPLSREEGVRRRSNAIPCLAVARATLPGYTFIGCGRVSWRCHAATAPSSFPTPCRVQRFHCIQ